MINIYRQIMEKPKPVKNLKEFDEQQKKLRKSVDLKTFKNNNSKTKKMKRLQFAAIVAASLAFTSCYDFNRQQREKDAESNGRAILLEAESSKKAMIEEAKAQNESATLQAEAKIKIARAEAQAEIERARGVAEANRIIGNSLEGNSDYLKYLMIQGLNSGKGERIYIPTEAGLPILEAKQ